MQVPCVSGTQQTLRRQRKCGKCTICRRNPRRHDCAPATTNKEIAFEEVTNQKRTIRRRIILAREHWTGKGLIELPFVGMCDVDAKRGPGR